MRCQEQAVQEAGDSGDLSVLDLDGEVFVEDKLAVSWHVWVLNSYGTSSRSSFHSANMSSCLSPNHQELSLCEAISFQTPDLFTHVLGMTRAL